RAQPERLAAFHRVPPVVATLHEAIDLLDAVLADVAAPQVAVRAVERDPPRVAHAVAPDLAARIPARGRRRGERIVRRDPVALRGTRIAHVDAQHLAEQHRLRLAV